MDYEETGPPSILSTQTIVRYRSRSATPGPSSRIPESQKKLPTAQSGFDTSLTSQQPFYFTFNNWHVNAQMVPWGPTAYMMRPGMSRLRAMRLSVAEPYSVREGTDEWVLFILHS